VAAFVALLLEWMSIHNLYGSQQEVRTSPLLF